ncbi:branched-chain amino acid ABC transporter permease [Pseudonocardia nigra]|uniref:branched-chain amino acid ABC transporter permease n=1 Tax=Pseudonocardia nigra TaxID=1921578 RepID=UPI001C5F17F2|nr:branched-chain amino acid ABC transporter permease [Pseudonocardia nigra]
MTLMDQVRDRATAGEATSRRRGWHAAIAPVVVLVVLAWLPYVSVPLPGVLPGLINSPGSMQLLALCLVFGGIALSYDLLFGRTGLLSFGHALFVAAGSYTAALALARPGGGLAGAIGLAVVVGVVLPLLVGAVALRVTGIAFAMVTLAFAQAGSIIVLRNPGGATGGEEGLPLNRDGLPDLLVGVVNAPYRYWLALIYLALCWGVVAWLVRSRVGHVWAAARENPERVAVLGLSVYRAQLLAVLVGGLFGTLGGVAHLLVVGGATPHLTTSELTLGLLVMVVLGGAGSRWGAVLGGVLYTYLDNRLLELASSDLVDGLPGVLRVPLSEPTFVLGALFVAVVFFAPGGLVGLARRRSRRKPA